MQLPAARETAKEAAGERPSATHNTMKGTDSIHF